MPSSKRRIMAARLRSSSGGGVFSERTSLTRG
jgi:hypothetical protein